MLPLIEATESVPKQAFERQLPELRAALVQAQLSLKQADFPVIVLISGVDGAGKGEVVHRLNEWLDPRGLDTQAFSEPSDEERERPAYWRFWRVLPARGRIAILFGSWYTQPLTQRVFGETSNRQLDRALRRIASFEKMLVEGGALLLKFALHLSKKAQRRRLKDLQKNPETHWRVLPSDWRHHKLYVKFVRTADRVMRQTHSIKTPWFVVDAADPRFRDLAVGRILLQSLRKQLAQRPAQPSVRTSLAAAKKSISKKPADFLGRVDLDQTLSENKYRKRLAKFQARLNRLFWDAHAQKISTVVVFEGWDAAGKGSSIRRVTEAIDPRLYRVIPIAAPNDEERAHHYLWRFWRHLPRAGKLTIFDRSWYGRVLVERIEGFAQPQEWRQAYNEINDFEEQLAEHGVVVAKFWIHISEDEQLRRFKERAELTYKRFKITEEDWRNRKKWDTYETAVNDMVARTSTEHAPWTLVAGNDKKFARIQILKTLCRRLGQAW